MVQDIQIEGYNLKNKNQMTLSQLATNHTKYYGILGLLSSDPQGSPGKSHGTSLAYNNFISGHSNLSPGHELKGYLSRVRDLSMSPQSPEQPPKDMNLEDRVLMTLGKIEDLEDIAKDS